jgi:hypothetical protein
LTCSVGCDIISNEFKSYTLIKGKNMSYGKNKLDCFYYIKKFEKHSQLKEKVLTAIDFADFKSPVSENCEINISKTDWDFSKNDSRTWLQILGPDLLHHVGQVCSDCGYYKFTMHEVWFQQYKKESQHGWHVHGSSFTNVYYLQLPEDAPKTLLVDPFTQKKIIELDVKEGDTVMFPSFVLHKTDKNFSNKIKTIVSWNLNVDYPDETYQEISSKFTFSI